MNKLKFVNIIFHTLSLFIANSVMTTSQSAKPSQSSNPQLNKEIQERDSLLGQSSSLRYLPVILFYFFSSGVASSYLALIALQSGKHRWYFVHPIFCRVVWHHPRRFLCTVKLSNFLVNGMLHCYTIPNFVHMISIDFSPHCSTNYISN